MVAVQEWLLCEPQTYMNRSGAAVRCLAERFNLAPDRILVIYDEVHLSLGRIRLRGQGSPAGHRGMESIVDALQTEALPRMRLGIGPVPPGLATRGMEEFVLGRFLPEEQVAVAAMVDRAAAAAAVWLADGIEVAMHRANTPDLPEALETP